MKRMKKHLGSLFAVVALGVAGLPTEACSQDDWTFMVYMDGDNNLEAEAIVDFLEISSVGSTADVNILVLFDRHAAFSTAYGDWDDTRRGIVYNGDEPTTSWGTSVGELNMGNQHTLIDFVEWGMQNYPATRYAAILWDHGNGWRGLPIGEDRIWRSVCVDDTSGDELDMSEVRAALSTIETDEGEVDLVGFDACLMAMIEVAYEIRQHSSVMVGSEKMEPSSGWPYDLILSDLVAAPTMMAASLGTIIVDNYYGSYWDRQTQSATDLSDALIDALTARVDVLAQRLRTEWNGTGGGSAAAAHEVILAMEDVIIAEAHGSSWPGSHGLAIYFPKNAADFDTDYDATTILFPGVTEWDEFLQDYYTSMGGSWVESARLASQVYDASAAAGVQDWHIDLYDFCLKVIDSAPDITWVDFAFAGTDESGTYDNPYDTLAEGVSEVAIGGAICIKAGSSSETMTITKEMEILACGGTVVVGY